MKKRKRKIINYSLKKYFILVILFFLVVFSYFEISNKFYITGYLKDILFYPSRYFSSNDFIDGINLELKLENEELKKIILVSESLSGFSPVYATVVERNSSYWFNSVTINKGSVDGITEGMAVVDYAGLVGTVEKVSFNTSVVSLITSEKKDNNISVRIDSEVPLNNILKVSNGRLLIEGVSKNTGINPGTFVFTNGLSDRFPSGILVGKVFSLESDSYNISNVLYIDVASNIDNLRFVAVLKRG